MELLKRMKREMALAQVPVVLHTEMGSREDILEGFRAGAYYYVPKPLEAEVFATIVHSAVQFGQMVRGLQVEHQKSLDAMTLLQLGQFRFRTLEEAWFLANLLGSACPDPERVLPGLSELMVNAVEHGNLGMGYEVKSRLNQRNAWLNEIRRRLDLPENRDKRAHIAFERREGEVRITIQDQGTGFPWAGFLDLDPARILDDHGRGIALAKMHSFDRVEYQGNGNTVVVTVFG
jgi:anti-sigma regulatory factor (Ser/Thr protein kinase)